MAIFAALAPIPDSPPDLKVSLWIAALVLPVKATDAGGSPLLVAATLLQFIGTVFGDRVDVGGGPVCCLSDMVPAHHGRRFGLCLRPRRLDVC